MAVLTSLVVSPWDKCLKSAHVNLWTCWALLHLEAGILLLCSPLAPEAVRPAVYSPTCCSSQSAGLSRPTTAGSQAPVSSSAQGGPSASTDASWAAFGGLDAPVQQPALQGRQGPSQNEPGFQSGPPASRAPDRGRPVVCVVHLARRMLCAHAAHASCRCTLTSGVRNGAVLGQAEL